MGTWLSAASPEPAAEVRAVGIGYPPPNGTINEVQGRLLAERAALVDALRNVARQTGRATPRDYRGVIEVGAIVHGFRIERITQLPDGRVEIDIASWMPRP